MRLFLLILILAAGGIVGKAFAADDFGSPFANQAPSALSDTAGDATANPWEIEPAAGEETETPSEILDLPMNKEEAIEQLKALEEENPNLIVDDLSP